MNANYLSGLCMVNVLIEVDKYRGGSCLICTHGIKKVLSFCLLISLFALLCGSSYYFSWIFFLSCMEVEMK